MLALFVLLATHSRMPPDTGAVHISLLFGFLSPTFSIPVTPTKTGESWAHCQVPSRRPGGRVAQVQPGVGRYVRPQLRCSGGGGNGGLGEAAMGRAVPAGVWSAGSNLQNRCSWPSVGLREQGWLLSQDRSPPHCLSPDPPSESPSTAPSSLNTALWLPGSSLELG